MDKESKKHTPALPNADTRRGGKNPSCAGLTSCTSPEVQSHQTENSHTGVSLDCVPSGKKVWYVFRAAHELAKNNRFEEALKILENQKHSPGEKSVACMTIYLLKAVCYAELGYRRSAVNCVNVVLSAGRGSINLVYQYAYSDLKKMAEEIEKEYSLKNE